VAEEIFQKVDESGLLRSQDGAAILLALIDLSKTVKPKISAKIWQHGDPLHPSNLPLLNKVLKDVSTEDNTVKSSGSFKGAPHFVWTFILQRYLEKSKEIVGFKSLWDTVVESIHVWGGCLIVDGFFADSSSLERRYLGYQLFLMFLPRIQENLVPALFSENFLRCLVNNSSAGDRYLSKIAKKSVRPLLIYANTALNDTFTVRGKTRDYS
jgi:DNA polymerase phi